MKETYPLKWPAAEPRTLLRDQEKRMAWKKTLRQILADLELELKRFKVLMPSVVVTMNDPISPDTGVAVWFSRERDNEHAWQTALQINNPAPTIDEISSAFRKLSAKHHPDSIARGSGGNMELFIELDKHRKAAIAFVNRVNGKASDFVIPCDKFTENQWNVAAIVHTIRSFRQMERDGTSRILEQAMGGFRPELTEGAHVVAATS